MFVPRHPEEDASLQFGHLLQRWPNQNPQPPSEDPIKPFTSWKPFKEDDWFRPKLDDEQPCKDVQGDFLLGTCLGTNPSRVATLPGNQEGREPKAELLFGTKREEDMTDFFSQPKVDPFANNQLTEEDFKLALNLIEDTKFDEDEGEAETSTGPPAEWWHKQYLDSLCPPETTTPYNTPEAPAETESAEIVLQKFLEKGDFWQSDQFCEPKDKSLLFADNRQWCEESRESASRNQLMTARWNESAEPATDAETKLKMEMIKLLNDPSRNPYGGSMPLEKIQNILSSDNGPYTQLYNEAVGKGKGKLSMFLSKHPEITVFGLEGGKKWRVRLTDNKDYEKGDQKEKAAIEAKEKHLLRTLEQYLNEQKDRSCEVDNFIKAYPTLPEATGPDGKLKYELPNRGDLVRFVLKHTKHPNEKFSCDKIAKTDHSPPTCKITLKS
jgi:hypothetical protein